MGPSLQPHEPLACLSGPRHLREPPFGNWHQRAQSGEVLAEMGDLIMYTLSQDPFPNKGFRDLSHTVPSVNENKSFAGSGVLQKKDGSCL